MSLLTSSPTYVIPFQGVFYPSGRQRCAFAGAYKSPTRQITRQKPSATRQEIAGIRIEAMMPQSRGTAISLPLPSFQDWRRIIAHSNQLRKESDVLMKLPCEQIAPMLLWLHP